MQETDPCHKCGSNLFIYRPGTAQHYKGRTCNMCHTFVWISKPDAIGYKRPNSHTDLVKEYSKGYCELCLIPTSRIPRWESLEAQHIIEFKDNGSNERGNIMIVCTRCHRLIHWVRTYVSAHILGIEDDDRNSEDTKVIEGVKPMGKLETDSPPW